MDEQLRDAIQELNLSYLILSQRLLQADFNKGILALGLSEEQGKGILALSSREMTRASKTPFLLVTLRDIDFRRLGDADRVGEDVAQIHQALLIVSNELKPSDQDK